MGSDKIIGSFSELHGRLGILGGSFDPIQKAHIEIARRAQKAHQLNSVLFLPNYQNPLKEITLASERDRIEMLSLALEKEPDFFLSLYEIEKGESCYTVDTIRTIQDAASDITALYFIAGSDCLPDLHKWREIHALLDLVELTICSRDEQFSAHGIADRVQDLSTDETEKLSKNAIVCEVIPISSTEIREQVIQGHIPYEELPNGVGEYIQGEKLYGWKG